MGNETFYGDGLEAGTHKKPCDVVMKTGIFFWLLINKVLSSFSREKKRKEWGKISSLSPQIKLQIK